MGRSKDIAEGYGEMREDTAATMPATVKLRWHAPYIYIIGVVSNKTHNACHIETLASECNLRNPFNIAISPPETAVRPTQIDKSSKSAQ